MPWKAYALLRDSGDNESVLRFGVDPTSGDTDFTANLAALGALVTDLMAVTNANVASYGLTWEVPNTDSAAAGSEIEAIGLISSRIDAEEEKWTNLRIPAPVDGIFVATSGPSRNVVDPSDADLGSYLENFETGGVFTVSDGETLLEAGVANTKGKRIHRGSRNG